MTRKRQAKTYVTRLYCDKCFQDRNSEIEMERNDVVLTSYPVKYQYACPNCEFAVMSTSFYPVTTVETVAPSEQNFMVGGSNSSHHPNAVCYAYLVNLYATNMGCLSTSNIRVCENTKRICKGP